MSSAPFGADEFRRETGVSRETLARLSAFVELLRQWQQKTNLIGPVELKHVWRRHIDDSAQLVPLLPEGAERWVDLGSGAGFPGLVVAILLAGRRGFEMHLVESNQRKAAFLRESARITGAPVTVHTARIEDLAPLHGDLVSARALSPLPQLLEFFDRHRAATGIGLFLRGEGVESELTEARKSWDLDTELLPSRTGSGYILKVNSARRHGVASL